MKMVKCLPCFATLFTFTKWCNSFTPMKRFISLSKKALPGLITEHAKFNKRHKEKRLSKKGSKDQELTQSSTTPDQGYHMGK